MFLRKILQYCVGRPLNGTTHLMSYFSYFSLFLNLTTFKIPIISSNTSIKRCIGMEY